MDTALIVRMRRMGTKKKPHHQIVVAESRKALDGRVVEQLGYFDPSKKPEFVKLNLERLDFWLKQGAKLSQGMVPLVKRLRKTSGTGSPSIK